MTEKGCWLSGRFAQERVMVYLITFGISALFAHQAKKSKSRGNFFWWSVLSILIPVLLAGLRGVSVGIDTKNYYNGTWSRALLVVDLPLKDAVAAYLAASRERFEVLYGLLVRIVAKTTGNYQVLLFLTHLIIVGGVYIGAFRMRDYADPDYTLLLFYLLYFNISLNISRQYMAMAILFAGVKDLEEGKYFRYFAITILAFLFHNTGIIGIAPLLVHRTLYPKESLRKVSSTRRIVTSITIVAAIYAFTPTVMLLINAGILSRKYLYYFNGEVTSSYTLVLLFLIVEGAAFLLFWKQFRKNGIHADFFIFCSFSFLLLVIFASQINYGKRIAAYFSFLNIISLGMLAKCPDLASNRKIMKFLVFFVVLVYWLYVYAYRNASQTFPYVLGI